MTGYIQAFIPLAASLLAGIIIVGGNYHLQRRVSRRLRDADELKHLLYKLLELAAEYWTSDDTAGGVRGRREARILASTLMILSECKEMGNHSRKLQSWLSETESPRLELMDAVTGGCFQQATWHQDPQRVTRAAREIGRIISSLNHAC